MGKLTKIDEFNPIIALKDNLEVVKEIGNVLYERRKEYKSKKTPEQFIHNKPVGGREADYVEAPYILDELKKFCNELFEVMEFTITDVFCPATKEENAHWVRCHGRFKDRSTGNIITGVGASRMKGNLDYGNACKVAETLMWKDFAKNLDICADIYARDVEAPNEELQERINKILNDLQTSNKYKDKLEIIKKGIVRRSSDEEELNIYLTNLEDRLYEVVEVKIEERNNNGNKDINENKPALSKLKSI